MYGFLLVAVIEICVIPLSLVFFSYTMNSHPILVAATFIVGTFGLVIVGATVSGLTMYTESRTILAPLLTFPLVLPIIIPSVTLTKKLINGTTLALAMPELRLITLTIVVLVVATLLLFRYILTD
jgi:heme exporter protein B